MATYSDDFRSVSVCDYWAFDDYAKASVDNPFNYDFAVSGGGLYVAEY